MWVLFASFFYCHNICVFAVVRMQLIHPTVRIDAYCHDGGHGGEACEGREQWQLRNIGVF